MRVQSTVTIVILHTQSVKNTLPSSWNDYTKTPLEIMYILIY